MTRRFLTGASAPGALGVCLITASAAAQAPPPPPPPDGITPAPSVPTPATTPPAPPPPSALPSGPADTAPRQPLSLLEVVQTALRTHPNIQIARTEVLSRQAELGLTKGPFDPVITANAGHTREAIPIVPSQRPVPELTSTTTDTTSVGVGASWASRWGMQVLPSLGIDRIHSRPGGSTTIPGIPTEPYHQARANLTVTQALLRGAGYVGAASAVEAASFSRDAAEHLAAHTAQTQVLFAASAYWQWVAAVRIVELLRTNEAGALKLVQDTTVLVNSDQRPASDLRQLNGNLAQRTREVQDAKNAEIRALLVLFEAMGLSAKMADLPRPANDFPAPIVPDASAQEFIRTALSSRRDLKALKRDISATEAALRGAEKNTQPALDVSVSVGYTGANDDTGVGAYLASVGTNVPGVSGGVGLSLELPVQNIQRNAERDLRAAQKTRAYIAAKNLERQLPIDVVTALNDLRLSAAALAASITAEEHYAQALLDEQDRLRAGVGTVIDVVLTQERLIRAQQSRTNDHARFSIALARLQFEMGLLPQEPDEALRAVNRLLGAASQPSRRDGGQ